VQVNFERDLLDSTDPTHKTPWYIRGRLRKKVRGQESFYVMGGVCKKARVVSHEMNEEDFSVLQGDSAKRGP